MRRVYPSFAMDSNCRSSASPRPSAFSQKADWAMYRKHISWPINVSRWAHDSPLYHRRNLSSLPFDDALLLLELTEGFSSDFLPCLRVLLHGSAHKASWWIVKRKDDLRERDVVAEHFWQSLLMIAQSWRDVMKGPSRLIFCGHVRLRFDGSGDTNGSGDTIPKSEKLRVVSPELCRWTSNHGPQRVVT